MIFNRNFIVLVFCVAHTTSILISASCNAGGKANLTSNDSNAVVLASQTPPSNQPAEQRSSAEVPSNLQEKEVPNSVRDIDFGNFTYSWYPSYLNPPDGRRELKLQNGKFDAKEDMHSDVKNLHVEFENVSYADLAGDGQGESIVTLGGVSVFNRFVGAVFIYRIENGKLKLIWHQETGDRADGGLRRIALEGRTLIIERYTRSEGDGGLCCPTKFIRCHYQLSQQQFKKIKSELFLSEYDYAKFLGYPGEAADKPTR
jgi:hypothetical protein